MRQNKPDWRWRRYQVVPQVVSHDMTTHRANNSQIIIFCIYSTMCMLMKCVIYRGVGYRSQPTYAYTRGQICPYLEPGIEFSQGKSSTLNENRCQACCAFLGMDPNRDLRLRYRGPIWMAGGIPGTDTVCTQIFRGSVLFCLQKCSMKTMVICQSIDI